ncbi:MAG: thiol-disulfide oxidoreductase DCC family protein [Bacteroidetes bacterium]|nr:MAG: thiol-disulfide oxidoreductase DCC family protein [Bacteroidota bacterium]
MTSSATHSSGPVLLFDGVCNLCNGSVQWILKRDRRGVFRYTALQSEAGQHLLRQYGLDPQVFNSVVLIADDRLFTRSDAALEVLRRLGWPWSPLAVLRLIPRPVRDAVYDWVARNRYRWFGRQDECWLPRPEWKDRFL